MKDQDAGDVSQYSRLDIAHTTVTSAGVPVLARFNHLETLNLTSTSSDNAALPGFAQATHKKLYLFEQNARFRPGRNEREEAMRPTRQILSTDSRSGQSRRMRRDRCALRAQRGKKHAANETMAIAANAPPKASGSRGLTS